MKIAINRCWGGFGISYKAVMRYAELAGFKLYPIVEKRIKGNIDFDHYTSYTGQKNVSIIHYLTEPLLKDGTYKEDSYFYPENKIERNDLLLIEVIEELGEKANGRFAEIEIVEIPDDVKWQINNYDGQESIHEIHRSW